MSKKREIAKELRLIEEEIKSLEIKRSRSQAALIEALISKTEPNTDDIAYFRAFTAQIDVKRDQLKKKTRELEDLI
ncbi:MAG: hypothetical protein NC184_01905 [Roseburia sp.]|nr:hypothetical protein [Roseburia sp.]